MMTCPFDVTYCAHKECPHKDCEIHSIHTKKFPVGTLISVADYSQNCARLSNQIKKGKTAKKTKP